MPSNFLDSGGQRRELDRLVINEAVTILQEDESANPLVQTVRGAFEGGEPVFEGSMIRRQTHIQLAVRDHSCIPGTFRPSLNNPAFAEQI